MKHPNLPPAQHHEYDTVIPVTVPYGLLLEVLPSGNDVLVSGYRRINGQPGPAELCRMIQNAGDKIIAIDGIPTSGKTAEDIIRMLKESCTVKPYSCIRFQKETTGRFAFSTIHATPKQLKQDELDHLSQELRVREKAVEETRKRLLALKTKQLKSDLEQCNDEIEGRQRSLSLKEKALGALRKQIQALEKQYSDGKEEMDREQKDLNAHLQKKEGIEKELANLFNAAVLSKDTAGAGKRNHEENGENISNKRSKTTQNNGNDDLGSTETDVPAEEPDPVVS